MWTGLTLNGSQVQDMGVAEFDVLDKSALPWRTGITPLSEEGDCVTMEITGLGVRLHREPCTAKNYFICQKFDGGRVQDERCDCFPRSFSCRGGSLPEGMDGGGCLDGRMCAWRYGLVDEWMDGWMDERIRG